MKAYAVSSKVSDDNRVQIQYGEVPVAEFRYATRERATDHCVRLNKSEWRVGSHRCAFAVDKLPGGDFGIICACHPLSCFGPVPVGFSGCSVTVSET